MQTRHKVSGDPDLMFAENDTAMVSEDARSDAFTVSYIWKADSRRQVYFSKQDIQVKRWQGNVDQSHVCGAQG